MRVDDVERVVHGGPGVGEDGERVPSVEVGDEQGECAADEGGRDVGVVGARWVDGGDSGLHRMRWVPI